MLGSGCRTVALGLLALALPGAAWAHAVIQSMNADVRVGSSNKVLIAARVGQRLSPGTTVVTGPDAQAVLKFTDGGQVVLHQNTEFRIVDSQYVASVPQADRAVFDLVKGALRVVTGAIGQRSRAAWALRIPQATIQVRGTDFMVAIADQAYIQVLQGAIEVSNGYDRVVFGHGAVASVPSSASLPAAARIAQVPPSVASAFGALSDAGVTGGVASGAGSATGGVGVGFSWAAAAAIGGVAAAAAAAAGDSSTTTTHH